MVYLFFVLVLLSLVLLLYMVFKAHHDKIGHHRITSEKIDKEFSLFFISDVHRRKIKTETLEQIPQDISFVVIGGDLTESGVPSARTRENIRKLKRWGAPIIFIWGNNDYDGDPNELYSLLQEEDVTILANRNCAIPVNGNKISLIGLDCCHRSEALFDVASEGAEGTYKILLTHAPSAFYELDREEQDKVDMVLAGHTHGGQIRILGFGFFKRGGLERIGNTDVLVSEGYGYTRLPMRLGTNAECQIITFGNKM
ncbi:metallophosphoesterase [Virgibacillus kekensis]|uniref:Metallophosphoesterase n=1 Tax=Virgibacillus kekensis TaxID=202261 RepID=A0ABV9DF23_9BACI